MNRVKKNRKKKKEFSQTGGPELRPGRLPPHSTDESTIPGHTEHWGSGENPKPAGGRDREKQVLHKKSEWHCISQ